MSKTPTCAICGTKFSMDAATMMCRECGAPAEASQMSAADIRRYRIAMRCIKLGAHSKRAIKRVARDHGGSKHRRRSKHGRQHA